MFQIVWTSNNNNNPHDSLPRCIRLRLRAAPPVGFRQSWTDDGAAQSRKETRLRGEKKKNTETSSSLWIWCEFFFFVSCKCQTVLAGDAERFSLKRQGDKIIRSKVETKKKEEEEEIQVLLVTAGFQSSRTLDLPASFLRKRPPLPHSCIYSPVDDPPPKKKKKNTHIPCGLTEQMQSWIVTLALEPGFVCGGLARLSVNTEAMLS